MSIVLSLWSHPAAAQTTCADPYYRWSAKIDASLADSAPHQVRLSQVKQWAALDLFAGDKCAPRQGLERRVYSVVGWVRKVIRHEADNDWHVELTSRRDSPAGSCIVAEIPLVDGEGQQGNYGPARRALDSLLQAAGAHIDADDNVVPAARLRFIGAAFFDGYHHTHAGGAYRHGNCNSSAGALWEIHPVYWVREPTD